ncbi:hypothetical protein Tco_0530792 [Tanacetum coccineum]
MIASRICWRFNSLLAWEESPSKLKVVKDASVLGGLSQSFAPMYCKVNEVKKVMSTEQPCDVAYEFGNGILDLQEYPKRFPKPVLFSLQKVGVQKFRKEDMKLSGSDAYMRRSDYVKKLICYGNLLYHILNSSQIMITLHRLSKEHEKKVKDQGYGSVTRLEKRGKETWFTLRARVADTVEEKKLELLFLWWIEHHKKLGNFLSSGHPLLLIAAEKDHLEKRLYLILRTRQSTTIEGPSSSEKHIPGEHANYLDYVKSLFEEAKAIKMCVADQNGSNIDINQIAGGVFIKKQADDIQIFPKLSTRHDRNLKRERDRERAQREEQRNKEVDDSLEYNEEPTPFLTC